MNTNRVKANSSTMEELAFTLLGISLKLKSTPVQLIFIIMLALLVHAEIIMSFKSINI